MREGEVIASRFRIDGIAGRGAMGAVYRGHDLSSGQTVAVKILQLERRDEVDRFAREASLLAQVTHPGVVRYLAHGVTGDEEPYLVMEWAEGRTLADCLEAEGLTVQESVFVAASAAEALNALHAAGIFHRDVKPRNLIFPEGRFESVKIIDLGLARTTRQRTSITRTGTIVGTPGYMSPEQARGERVVDGRSDIFSLGCVLYECLTGLCAFHGPTLFAVQTKIILWEPPPVRSLNPGISPKLEKLVGEMLAKSPSQRPADAAAVAARLRALEEADSPKTGRGVRRGSGGASTVSLEETLVPDEERRLQFILQVGSENDEGPLKLDEGSVARLVALVHRAGGQVERVGDGWFVVMLSASGKVSQVTAWAMQRALSLRTLIPSEVPVALVGAHGEALDQLIDRAVLVADAEVMDLVFLTGSSHPGRGGVRVEESIVHCLDGFEVVRGRAGYYVRSGPEAEIDQPVPGATTGQ
ncbi:MAG: serine/threonine protein kinase [Myxococcales bacterium]|nr:serine/threonine protein kinase [Myxococcales bacterium]